MPDPQGLDIHDVVISNQPQFTRTGGVQQITVVTFAVGDHGPFTLSYAKGEATPAQIKADMARQVADLRAILHPEM